MNENTMSQSGSIGTASVPFEENKYVKEMLGILQENGKDTSGFTALIGHVNEMESFAQRADEQIANMKAQLDAMKEVQDHPIKTALQKAIAALENKIAEIKAQIAELKSNIVEGCKNAAAAFKEKGAAVLDKLASFFKIKSGLQAIKNSTVKNADSCDKAVAKIQAFSKEYHETGRHLKNMARVIVGKQPIDTAKESGKLAKVISAPYKTQKAHMLGIRKQVDKMIAALDNLEKNVEANRGKQTPKRKKVPMMERLDAKKNEIKEREREAPTVGRGKVQVAEV